MIIPSQLGSSTIGEQLFYLFTLAVTFRNSESLDIFCFLIIDDTFAFACQCLPSSAQLGIIKNTSEYSANSWRLSLQKMLKYPTYDDCACQYAPFRCIVINRP